MKRVISLNVLLLVLLGMSNCSVQKRVKSVDLFNGRDLGGWYTFIKDRGKNLDPKNVFTVSDGLIRISGEEYGCITTNDEYESYHLRVEFKWGEKTFEPRKEKTRDSGVLLHSQGEDGGYAGTWMHSIECQLIEGGTGDFIVVGDGTDKFAISTTVAAEKVAGAYVYDPNGEVVRVNGGRINWYGRAPEWKDVLGFRGAQDVEKPVGEWNVLECIAKGDEITYYLNGVKVNHAFDVKPRRGRIQIQSEGAEMFVRTVKLTPLN